jgi:hypothetical protein
VYAEETTNYISPIGCYNKEGVLLRVFKGSEEMKEAGYIPSHIYAVAAGNTVRKSHRGLKWERIYAT